MEKPKFRIIWGLDKPWGLELLFLNQEALELWDKWTKSKEKHLKNEPRKRP